MCRSDFDEVACGFRRCGIRRASVVCVWQRCCGFLLTSEAKLQSSMNLELSFWHYSQKGIDLISLRNLSLDI